MHFGMANTKIKYHNVYFNVLFSSYTRLNVSDGIYYTYLAVVLVF